jgi:hypothetical protein
MDRMNATKNVAQRQLGSGCMEDWRLLLSNTERVQSNFYFCNDVNCCKKTLIYKGNRQLPKHTEAVPMSGSQFSEEALVVYSNIRPIYILIWKPNHVVFYNPKGYRLKTSAQLANLEQLQRGSPYRPLHRFCEKN